MKNFRGTFIFAAIVAAIGFFALQEFRKSQVEQEEGSTKDQVYKLIKPEDVQSVEFEGRFKLSRDSEGWQITSPVEDLADLDDVTSFLQSLFSQNVESLDLEGVPPGVELHKRYGLDQPQAQINFQTKAGTQHKLVFGSVKTYDNGYYIKRDNDSEIWVGMSGFDSSIQKNYNDLRYKKLRLQTGDPVRLTLKSTVEKKVSSVSLVRKDGLWMNEKDSSMKIDAAQINSFISELRGFQASSIAADAVDKKSLSEHKLNQPNLQIEIFFADDAKNESQSQSQEHINRVSFQIPKSGEATYYSSTNKAIYRVSDSKAREFIKDISAFRDKVYPFQFAQENAAQIELRRKSGADRFAFEKKNTDWNLVKTTKELDNKQAIQADISSLLSDLKNLKAEGFLPTNKTFKALGEVNLKDAQGQLLFELSYGGLQKGQDEQERYMVKTNLAKEVLLLAKSNMDSLFDKKLIEDSPAAEAPKPEEMKSEAPKSEATAETVK
jgi:hypothetical protein